jgi:hypothetical protein
MSEQPVDDKAHIRNHLDLARAEWIRAEPEGVTLDVCIEYAFIEHTDGITYTAMRKTPDPDEVILVFTPSEWEAFVEGVEAGAFNQPKGVRGAVLRSN